MSGTHKVFIVANGANMKDLLPNDYKKLSDANFFLVPQSFSTADWHSPHVFENTSYFLVNKGAINNGNISYDAATGIVNISAPNWTASTYVPNLSSGNVSPTLSFSGLGTANAICVYPAP